MTDTGIDPPGTETPAWRHLAAALASAEDPRVRYHIRQALQFQYATAEPPTAAGRPDASESAE